MGLFIFKNIMLMSDALSNFLLFYNEKIKKEIIYN